MQVLRSLQLLLVRQTRCKFAWHESHRAQAARKASLMRCLEMRSYQLLKRKKSERLLKMGEEKWPLQVREQRGLCLQCLAKSSIYWSKRVVGGVDKKAIRAKAAVGERSSRSFPRKGRTLYQTRERGGNRAVVNRETRNSSINLSIFGHLPFPSQKIT